MFGVSLSKADGASFGLRSEDPQLCMIVYLQVVVISQALIFVTRSHGFFFMERPSFALIGAFCVAQLMSTCIAAYADWGFAKIHSISGRWIGIVWVWVRLRLDNMRNVLVNDTPFPLEYYMVYAIRLRQIRYAGYGSQMPPQSSRYYTKNVIGWCQTSLHTRPYFDAQATVFWPCVVRQASDTQS
jgi:hypothetical protein